MAKHPLTPCKHCDAPCRAEYCSKACEEDFELWAWVMARDRSLEERRDKLEANQF